MEISLNTPFNILKVLATGKNIDGKYSNNLMKIDCIICKIYTWKNEGNIMDRIC